MNDRLFSTQAGSFGDQIMRYFLSIALLLLSFDVLSKDVSPSAQSHFQQKCAEIDLLNESANKAYTQSNYLDARKWSEEARVMAEKINYAKGCEEANLTLAEVHYDSMDLNLSMSYFQKVLELKEARGDQKGISYCLNNIGLLYRKMSNYEEAMKYHFMSLKIADEINDLERIASATNNIGYIYDTLENYSRALEYHFRSLECGQALGDQVSVAKTYGNIGVIFRKQGEFEQALDYYNKALIIYENDPYGQATILNNISNAHMAMNQLDNALRYGERALNLAEDLNDEDLKGYTLSSIGDIFLKKDELERALAFQKDALELTTDNELLKHIYKSIILIYGKLDDDTNLIKHHKLYLEAENHMLAARANKRTRDILINYETEKQQRDTEILDKSRQIKELMLYLQVAGYLILILFIFHLYSRYRNKVKLARKLDMMARIDPLTRLPNRRDMLERIETEVCRIERAQNSFTIVMSDIDNFKKINDTYGHDTGDMVLKKVTAIMREVIRKQDVVSRWGGEEFLFLLPDTDQQGGVLIAEKVRQLINGHKFVVSDGDLKVSVTSGVCEYQLGMVIQSCIQQADEALYRGKKAGKNQVITCEERH